MVTILRYNERCVITDLHDKEVLKDIDFRLSYKVQGFQFMKNVNNRWDGRHRLFKDGAFPAGMLDEVKKVIASHYIKFKVIDKRIPLEYGESIPQLPSKFEKRGYQVKAINAAIDAGSGICRMCTGSGKSYVLSSIVAHYNIPTIIYVVSVDLLYQMIDTLKESFGIEAGMVGDGICDIKKINVVTIWSAGAAFNKKLEKDLAEDIRTGKKTKEQDKARIRELVHSANLVILDEGQYAGATTVRLLSRESKSATHKFLFSGTPWRENGDDIWIEAFAGKKIIDVSASQLIDEGYLVRPEIVFKDVPMKRGIGKKYPEVYKNYIVENKTRNQLAINVAKSFYKNNKKILFLIRNIKHGKIISEMLDEAEIPHIFLDGSNSSNERNDGIQKINEGEIRVVIASTIFDIGIDIPSLEVLINLGGGKSTGRMLQRIGRVIRGSKGKTQAYVVDFFDQCKFLRDHSKVRMKTVEMEPSFLMRRIQ